MYASSPAWSFKSKHPVKKQAPTPSPDAYQPRMTASTPKSSSNLIGKEARNTFHPSNNPAPNQYQPSHPTKCKKYGVIGRENLNKKRQQTAPGPGSYDPVKKVTKKGFVMGRKYKQVDDAVQFPGPGRYETPSYHATKGILLDRQPRFSVEHKENVPGPGRYETKRPNSASIYFGKSQRMPTQPEFFLGPGQYDNKTLFQTNYQASKGFSIPKAIKKLRRVIHTETPGPGTYSPKNCDLEKSPSPSMGAKIKERDENRSPSPNQYTPQYFKLHCQTENYSICRAERKPLYKNDSGPGPGAYLTSNFTSDGPDISVSGKRDPESQYDVPGPGAYNPKQQVLIKRPQTAKLGKSKRFERMDTETGPSPGQYQNMFETISPRYSFCRKKRMQLTTSDAPGPGCYQIPSTLCNTPQYSK